MSKNWQIIQPYVRCSICRRPLQQKIGDKLYYCDNCCVYMPKTLFINEK